jgi:hypothetical protein
MRIILSKPARLGGLAAGLFAAIALATLTSCGGGSGERAADSGSPPEPQTRVASVDVTYYYLPG